MSDYTRMVLVRPDMVRDSTSIKPPPDTAPAADTSAATRFYETQALREKLSPQAGLVEVLVHLQKKASEVLHDKNLPPALRLSVYDDLLTKSSILTRKAQAGVRLPNAVNVQAVTHPNTPVNFTTPESSEIDDDASSTISDLTDTAPLPQTTPHRSTETGLDAAIRAHIPRSYQGAALKLYRLLTKQGKGAINWNANGELVSNNQVIPGTDIVKLLADAARPKTRGTAPPGRAIFIKLVKRVNPSLKHVNNKNAFQLSPVKASGSTKTKHTSQAGSGLKKSFQWRTTL